MAPLSLRIVQDGGAVTRKVKLDPNLSVADATKIVHEKANLPPEAKAYGLFLRSLDSDLTGIWLEDHRKLSDYLLRDGDQLDYMSRIRNLRLRMLDDTIKTFQVDQSKEVGDLMLSICSKIGITNHEEYGMCIDQKTEDEECKEKLLAATSHSSTLTLKKRSKLEDRDKEFEQLSKKLKTDDNVDWIDTHKSLSEACIFPTQTLLLKRRLFYSDRNVDSRDPVQLNLLYNQARDNILNSRHPVTEDKAADCKVRWINIRDVHRRIIRKAVSGGTRPKRAYKYDKPLEFMKSYYKEVVQADPEQDSEDEAEKASVTNTSSAWSDVVIEYDHDDSSNDAQSMNQAPMKKRKKAHKTQKLETFEEVEVPSASLNEKQEFDVADPVDAFLISIGATLKRFSPYHLNLAKSKIFHIVQEHDLQQIVERQPNRSDSITISSETPVFYQG